MSMTAKSDLGQEVLREFIVKLGYTVDDAPLLEVKDALDAITLAARRAREELAKLGDFHHGGITIKMVGSVMTCEVKPPAVEISGQPVA